jgi:ADP-ribose pyrophosphatase
MKPFKTLSSQKVFVHPWETIEIEKVQLKNGKIVDYLISKPNPFVIILVTNSQKQILILKQYKHGAKMDMYGFPAGFINKNESILHAAKRELAEETSIVAKNWKKLGTFYENPTRSPVKFYVFSAQEAKTASASNINPDIIEGEIEAMWVSKEELEKNLYKKFLSAPMLTALATFLAFFAKKDKNKN